MSNNTCRVGEHKAKVISAGDGADMKAAVGSRILVTHRKPHNMVAVNLNGSCGRTDDSVAVPKCFSTALPNGNGAVDMNVELNKQLNGTLDTPPLSAIGGILHEERCKSPPKSEGQHSNNQSSLTGISNEGRLMCPELAFSYTSTMIGKRAGCLANKQRDLERRVASLQRKIRLRQLHMVHSHACRQLQFDSNINDQDTSNMGDGSNMDGSGSSLTDSDFSMEISPPRTRVGAMDLPSQVDGSSDEAFFPLPPEVLQLGGEGGGPSRKRTEDSFSSVDSCISSVSPSEVEGDGALMAQLASLESLLDEDLTEVSSDEEGEESADLHYR